MRSVRTFKETAPEVRSGAGLLLLIAIFPTSARCLGMTPRVTEPAAAAATARRTAVVIVVVVAPRAIAGLATAALRGPTIVIIATALAPTA